MQWGVGDALPTAKPRTPHAPPAARRIALSLLRDARAPWAALAIIVVFGLTQTALIFHNYHLGLLGDDYDFLVAREGLNLHTLLLPHWENFSAVGVLIYRLLFGVFGITTAVPYIAVLLLSMGACAVLVHLLARPYLGPWVALVIPLILVTLGPAGEALLWPEFTPILGFAFWLGGMVLIRRGHKRSDVAGCGLLVLGIATHSVAVSLLPATALALVLWSGWRGALRRAWVVAVPLALYLAWYVDYHPSLERSLAHVPGFVVNAFAATVSDLSGISDSSTFVPVLAGILIGAVCLRCLFLRRVPKAPLYMGAGLLLLWIAEGLSEGPGRAPSESRYQFFNAALLMLALAPLLPRPRIAQPSHWTLVRGTVLAGFVAAIVVSNLGRYGFWEEAFPYQEAISAAELAALEVARPAVVDPQAVFTTSEEPGLYFPFTPHAYFHAVDAQGSPVSLHKNLELAFPPARERADMVLVRVEQIQLRGSQQPGGSMRPHAYFSTGLKPAGPGCALIPAGYATSGYEVVAPPGGLIIRAGAGPAVRVGVARYSEAPASIPIGSVSAGSEAWVPIQPDNSAASWRVALTGPQAITVCSLAT